MMIIRLLSSLLLICLFLTGCASHSHGTPASNQGCSETGYYHAGSQAEEAAAGALRAYPMKMDGFSGFLPMGQDILVFSHLEDSSRLTLLSGDSLSPKAEITLERILEPTSETMVVNSQGLHFFNGSEFQILDSELKEVDTIQPPDLKGIPLLSRNRQLLYYCCEDSVRSFDLASGICRVLKEISYPVQTVTGLYLDDSIIRLLVADPGGATKTMYISVDTGAILYETGEDILLSSEGSRYYAAIFRSGRQVPVFGKRDSQPEAIQAGGGNCFFLPECHAAVIAEECDTASFLRHIDLNTGRETALLKLPQTLIPSDFAASEDGFIWFSAYDPEFQCDTLYRWDPSLCEHTSGLLYTQPHYTRDNPDYEGLAACSRYAEALSERFGIRVLIYKDAVRYQPEDYDLTLEYQVPLIRETLQTLETCLQVYPEAVFQKLNRHFSGIHVCLVSCLSGSGDTEYMEGAQYFSQDFGAYIALATGQRAEYTLYHEMSHLIDTVLLNETTVHDRWDLLNPPGFSYDYGTSQPRTSQQWLREDSRYFVDLDSMHFPKEDRARIMEYAMTPGNENLFRSVFMQQKLLSLCEAIRQAFDLRKSEEAFLWEQYLNQSLAYQE